MQNLRVVSTDNVELAHTRLIVVGKGKTRQVEVEERETPIALIGFALSRFYTLGGLVDTKTPYGTQVSAEISYLWRGEKHALKGVVVPLVDGPDIVIPIGTLRG